MTISMNLGKNSYDILVENGILLNAKEYLNLNRRVLILTDSGVPKEYAEELKAQCKESIIYTIEQGESSKSLKSFEEILLCMLNNGFSRKDCVVAVGGGVVGDLAGFVASAYMRGVDFYNIPTTLLSQIDSSIGGKTAVNFGGVKNIVGAFYQPKKVLIDPDLLNTLSSRQFNNGLAEAIKMALTSSKELFDILENKDIKSNIKQIIIRSLEIKKHVVEEDEKEQGLRKILNFGHTIGHGIETTNSNLYHGECVALGIIPMCAKEIRTKVITTLKKCNLYNEIKFNWEEITKKIIHDKKANDNMITVAKVNEIGSYELKTITCNELIELAKNCLENL